MANVENFNKVIECLKSEKTRFNMEIWLDNQHYCGTVACIGGTCELLMQKEKKPTEGMDSAISMEHIAEWLGVSELACAHMFYGQAVNLIGVDRKFAIEMLEMVRDGKLCTVPPNLRGGSDGSIIMATGW